MATTPLTADELRPYKAQALNILNFAREQNATSIKAEVKVDDEPLVTYTIKRDVIEYEDPKDNQTVENIEVKRGRSSAQVILFAGPASWLEA